MTKGWLTAIASLALVQCLYANPAPFQKGEGDAVSFRTFEDDAGGFYLAWVDQQAKKVVGLCVQHMDAKGQASLGAEGLCISAHLASSVDWSGLADGHGGLILFWDEPDGVHARRFRQKNAFDKPERSVLMSTSTAIQPDATADASGGTLVAWREQLPGQNRSVIMAQRLDGEGRPVWPKGGIRVSLRGSNQTNPRVIYDNMSGMIVAWRDEANQASEMRVQRIDFQANRLWTLEGLKVTTPMGAAEFPRIAPLGTGAVVIAWNGLASQVNQIFLQKVGPEAELKWGDKTLASNIRIPYNRWNPVLVGNEEGGTWIAWEDFRDQSNYQIQLNQLREDGASTWPVGEIPVAPAAGDQGKMTMTSDGNRGVWLAWIDNRLATIGLYVQEIDSKGFRIQGAKGRLVADQLKKPSEPQIISLGGGRAVVSWADRPKKGQWELFWSIVEAPLPTR